MVVCNEPYLVLMFSSRTVVSVAITFFSEVGFSLVIFPSLDFFFVFPLGDVG